MNFCFIYFLLLVEELSFSFVMINNQTKCGIIYEKIAMLVGDNEQIINYEWPYSEWLLDFGHIFSIIFSILLQYHRYFPFLYLKEFSWLVIIWFWEWFLKNQFLGIHDRKSLARIVKSILFRFKPSLYRCSE